MCVCVCGIDVRVSLKETLKFIRCTTMDIVRGQAISLGDVAAQKYVDADALVRTLHDDPSLDLSAFPLLTRVPLRISKHVRLVRFEGCHLLTSATGLPDSVTCVDFNGCSALESVAGLTCGVCEASFDGCTSLTSVTGLPPSVKGASFAGCTSLVSLAGLPQNIELVNCINCSSLTSLIGLSIDVTEAHFNGCRRFRRVFWKPGMTFGEMENPASEVCTIMRSGVSDRLLDRVGPDVALLVGCFATAGLNPSVCSQDRMETRQQVTSRYSSNSQIVSHSSQHCEAEEAQ